MATLKFLLSENLRRILLEKNISQSELSRRTDFSIQTINRIAKGHVGVSSESLAKIAKALDVEESELFADRRKPEPIDQIQMKLDKIYRALDIATLHITHPDDDHLENESEIKASIPKDILDGLSKLDAKQKDAAWMMIRGLLSGLKSADDESGTG